MEKLKRLLSSYHCEKARETSCEARYAESSLFLKIKQLEIEPILNNETCQVLKRMHVSHIKGARLTVIQTLKIS